MAARVVLLSFGVLGGALFAGCGAKTGLDLPDAQIDAPPMMDAGVDADIPCIELDPDSGILELPLETAVEVGRADVVFLVDTTASMGSEIDEIRDSLRDLLVPGIRRAIPDATLGVATFEDFPEPSCGRAGDSPFELVLPVTDDVGRVQSAVNSLTLGNGDDMPESQVEALYQLATGEGLVPYVRPSFGCPSGGLGYACFRADALPVVLLFTDAPFHVGPRGANPYTCGRLMSSPHDYADAVRVLDAIGARVMGLYSGPAGGEGRAHLDAIARDTNAVADGRPLVFDIGSNGEGLSNGVIQAIQTLADVVEFDIDAFLVDPDPRDRVDPRDFVEGIRAVRATPPDGVREIDRERGVFRGVRTGTTVVFSLALRNDAVAPGRGPQRFRLEVVFRGDGRTRLGSRIIEIVIPGEDGSGCEDPGGAVTRSLHIGR